MTLFWITERGGWWYPVIQHGIGRKRMLGPQVGILEASRYVMSVWRRAQYQGLA